MSSTLTDAELVVAGEPGMAVLLPAWTGLDTDCRTTAREAARVSLVARGLLDAEGGHGLAPRLRATLTLRAGARARVVARRLLPGGSDHWCAHLVRDVVLLEQVSGDGVHRFALGRAGALPGFVASAVLHPSATDALSPRPPADASDLARVDVVTTVAGERPRLCSLLSGPAGTWQVTGGAAEVLEPLGVTLARDLLREAVARLSGGGGDAR